MKRIVALSLTFLCGIIFSLPALSQNYGYVNPFNKDHTISIQISPAFFAGGDRAIDAKFCDQSDLFVCIISSEFNFAVPITKMLSVSKWEYNGETYSLISQETMEIFGNSIEIWIIESIQGSKKIRYSYSRKHGLMAFFIEMDGESYVFLSQRTFGFGRQLRK